MDRASRIERLKKLRRKEKEVNGEEGEKIVEENDTNDNEEKNDTTAKEDIIKADTTKSTVVAPEAEREDLSTEAPQELAHQTIEEPSQESLPVKVTDDLRKDIQHYFDRLKALTEFEINNIIQQKYQESIKDKV